MNDQISSSFQVPVKWQERFLLKRIGEEDIEITLEQRNAIIQALGSNSRYVQVGKHTLMVNGIKSIDPKWGEANIPPRPKKKTLEGDGGYYSDDSEGTEWDKIFSKKLFLKE